MNERIKELWENCDEIHTRYPKQGSPIYASPELLEKFAELIVRDCAGIAREIGNNTEPDDFALDRCYEIEDQIKEHFGVEE